MEQGRSEVADRFDSGLSTQGMMRTLGMSLYANAWIYVRFAVVIRLPIAGRVRSPYGWNTLCATRTALLLWLPTWWLDGWRGSGAVPQ